MAAAWLPLVLSVCLPAGADSAGLSLVPYPRSVVTAGPGAELARLGLLRVPALLPDGALDALVDELRAAGVPRPTVVRDDAREPVLTLCPEGMRLPAPSTVPRGVGPEAYELRCDDSGVVVAAPAVDGLMRGCATLRQLIRANCRGGRLPAVRIRDWPALRWRACMDDLTRGPSTTLAALRREVELGAYLRLNAFTYYMEYQYAFRTQPLLGPADGSLAPEELGDLVRHASAQGVEVIGNQQSFAHMEHVLKHPENAAIAETPYLLNPCTEATYQFLDSLYSEEMPRLTSPFFNVCCDETYGLGTGPAKERVDREGAGAVYVDHVLRLHDLVTGKYGKRMMMWGDIILAHPEQLDRIPRDVVMLTWGYGAQDSFVTQIEPFANSGFEFFVCPGTSNWGRVLPDFATAARNIEQFVRDGADAGALGAITTVWDDDGLTLDPQNWYGAAWGAECAWTGSATHLEDFERRLGAVLFGEPGHHFGDAMAVLRRARVRFGSEFFTPPSQPITLAHASQAEVRLAAIAAERALLREALGHLEACARSATANRDLLEYFEHGVRRLDLIEWAQAEALRSALDYRAAQLGEAPRDTALDTIARRSGELRAAYAASRVDLERLWRAIYRPYALDRSLSGYDRLLAHYDARIAAVERARAAAPREALPDAASLGLALDVQPSPRLSPTTVATETLEPETPWADTTAACRVGLTIAAGPVRSCVLPVEIDLTLPPGTPSEPVRAWVRDAAGGLAEIPAQLEATGAAERFRLACVLPAARPSGDVTVWLYLGTSVRSALPASAGLRQEPDGLWLNNDRVRLRVSPAGAHVTHWSARALGERDLTFPGEEDWAGLSDVNSYRTTAHELFAGTRGPAVARCFAVSPDGLVKTLSLYAGASWLEVNLSRPVAYYWDFEDPSLFAVGGRYLFEDGSEGPAPSPPGDVTRQVSVEGARWGAKLAADGLLLALLTPDAATTHVVGPGGGAGGVGVERGQAVDHFVTYCDAISGSAGVTLDGLAAALRGDALPRVTVYAPEPAGSR